MKDARLNLVPVLFIVFNRPDTTRRVFDAIRQARPPRLYIAADGPRGGVAGEESKIQAVRACVLAQVDWPCEVKTLFREKNLGCKVAVSSAIDWFFEHEEEGVILEDDCLPNQSFFDFCQDLLQKYRDDSRVMMISGDNFLPGRNYQNSYYFSRYCHIWGWATWRRAWKFYDVTMRLWPEVRSRDSLLESFSKKERSALGQTFDAVWSGKVDTWDVQWVFSVMIQHGLSIMPAVNLVSNIGFGAAAVHTKKKILPERLFQKQAMVFPLKHPSYMLCDHCADTRTQDLFRNGFFSRMMPIISSSTRMFLEKIF